MLYLNYKTYVINSLFVLPMMFMWTSSDGFKTITELETLIHTQESVVHDLGVYVSQEKRRLKYLKSYLRRLKVNKRRMETSSNFLKNPINVMMILKRLTVDYNAMTRKSKTSGYYRNGSFTYPSIENFQAAVINFAHLVAFYNLNLTHLVRGKLSGKYSYTKQHYIERFTPLSTGDCYEVGQALMTMEEFDYALKWNLEALDLFSYNLKDHKTYGFKLQDIVSMIGSHLMVSVDEANDGASLPKRCLFTLDLKEFRSCFSGNTDTGDSNTGLKWSKINSSQNPKAIEWLKKNKKHVVARMRDRHAKKEKSYRLQEKKLLEKSNNIPIGKKHLLHSMTLFKHFCMGEPEVSKNSAKKLTCSYLHGPHPYLRLIHIKLEHLFIEPSVVLFHHVLSDSEIQHLMELTKPYFRSSNIGSRDQGSRGGDSFRVSTTAWLEDPASPVIEQLSRRVRYLTDLDVRYSEGFQVLEYGPGGRYLPHFDWPTTSDDINSTQGRLATVIFYLSEPTQGGATAFPELGLSVYPEKGSALMWTNLHPTGLMDSAMLHGGCPVLRGSKWVANKWISRIGQELIQPCPASNKHY